jgi:3-oxoacyl-[acyl-carrier protein] reductase
MKKNIVCIGGTKGIGKSVIKLLLEKEHTVYLFSRTPLNDELSASSLLHHTTYDVNNDFPKDALPENVDGYIYFPGSINLRPFERFSMDEFQEDLNINYLNNIKILQQIMPFLKKSTKDPSIVFFSTVAVQTGMSFHTSIAGAKGALEGLTKSLAAEFAPKLRVNCISPSLTDTPLAQKITSNERMREASAAKHPLKRIGRPEDLAQIASFLLGNESSWITGQNISCDGGMGSLK